MIRILFSFQTNVYARELLYVIKPWSDINIERSSAGRALETFAICGGQEGRFEVIITPSVSTFGAVPVKGMRA